MAWRTTLEQLDLLCGRGPYGPICRAPICVGGFTKRQLSADEVSCMRDQWLLAHSVIYRGRYRVSQLEVHYTARGIDDMRRPMLGRRAIDESLACYSRDLLARPLRDLCGMLLNIKLGHFNPDGARSGYTHGNKLLSLRHQ